MGRILLASPHMGGTELEFIQQAFDSNWIAPAGPHIPAFENDVANYVEAKNAVALSSGTASIHLALKSLGVTEGDIVFCSSLTFAASVNPVLYQKATPVFIDSDYKSWNMDPIALQKAFDDAFKSNRLPKAVIVVHLYGQSCDMDKIKAICDSFNVPIIEDAAESLGATYKGKQTGTIGDVGVYSFNGNKIITTSGGGMLVTNDNSISEKVRFWSTQSKEPAFHYEHKEIGYNYRMSNICAGIGLGQITVLDERIKKKKEIFTKYKEELSDLLDMMPILDYGQSNYWLSAATFKDKDQASKVIEVLSSNDVECRPVWKPMHIQPAFHQYRFFSSKEVGSVSEDLFKRGLCLPSDTKMTNDQQQTVIDLIKGAIS